MHRSRDRAAHAGEGCVGVFRLGDGCCRSCGDLGDSLCGTFGNSLAAQKCLDGRCARAKSRVEELLNVALDDAPVGTACLCLRQIRAGREGEVLRARREEYTLTVGCGRGRLDRGLVSLRVH